MAFYFMKKELRIKKNEEFSKIISLNKYFSNSLYKMYYAKLSEENSRVGISVSKKIGNAVVRNKIKRQIRMMLIEFYDFKASKYDLVIIVKEFNKSWGLGSFVAAICSGDDGAMNSEIKRMHEIRKILDDVHEGAFKENQSPEAELVYDSFAWSVGSGYRLEKKEFANELEDGMFSDGIIKFLNGMSEDWGSVDTNELVCGVQGVMQYGGKRYIGDYLKLFGRKEEGNLDRVNRVKMVANYYVGLGLLIGFMAGFIFEEKYVNFENTEKPLKIILRIIGAVIVFGVVYVIFKVIVPSSAPAYLVNLSKLICFALGVFLTFGVYPLVFKKFQNRLI